MSVSAGIDNLIANKFEAISGMRVGLVTNHTGLTLRGLRTIDVLHQAQNVDLAALFAPEHGIRGALDELVADDIDTATGLPIYSLYTETKQPSPTMFVGLDAVLFDIQDIGSRFYTYISTLAAVARSAAQVGCKLVVLDRPNPIRGDIVEGPTAKPDCLSFTACHTLPVRHGLTVGEFARLYADQMGLALNLQVITCNHWSRHMGWEQTGRRWINPSPNMRSSDAAILYPGIGLLELTNVSVGRGTSQPFEVVGAPWMDASRIANELSDYGHPGATFTPVEFIPDRSVYGNQPCKGVRIALNDRSSYRSVTVGLHLAVLLRDIHRGDYDPSGYARLLANSELYDAYVEGISCSELIAQALSDSSQFANTRRKYLLYA